MQLGNESRPCPPGQWTRAPLPDRTGCWSLGCINVDLKFRNFVRRRVAVNLLWRPGVISICRAQQRRGPVALRTTKPNSSITRDALVAISRVWRILVRYLTLRTVSMMAPRLDEFLLVDHPTLMVWADPSPIRTTHAAVRHDGMCMVAFSCTVSCWFCGAAWNVAVFEAGWWTRESYSGCDPATQPSRMLTLFYQIGTGRLGALLIS